MDQSEKTDEIFEKKEDNFEPESLLKEKPEKDFPDLKEDSSLNFQNNKEAGSIGVPTSNEDQFTKIEVDFFGNQRVFSIPEEFNYKLENKPDNKDNKQLLAAVGKE